MNILLRLSRAFSPLLDRTGGELLLNGSSPISRHRTHDLKTSGLTSCPGGRPLITTFSQAPLSGSSTTWDVVARPVLALIESIVLLGVIIQSV